MSKQKLDIPIQFFYKVVAITSSLKNYRIAFLLNEALNLNLKKVDDLKIDDKKNARAFAYEQQKDETTCLELDYFLFNNKTIGKQLLPSLKGFDYIFIVKSESEIENYNDIYLKIKEIQKFKIVLKIEKLSPRDNSVVEKQIIY